MTLIRFSVISDPKQVLKKDWSVGIRAKILSTFGYSFVLAIYTQGPGNVTHGSAMC